MKSNAPWSVKGIEKDARETAKAAAQREGMTVGEWLNQIIYTAGDPDAAPTTGEIEGLKARDLAAAIEHLSKRIAIAESKSAAAVDNLARSLGGAVERLQRIERSEPASGSADEALAARIKLLEEKSTDRQRIEALRALERAVGQIAVQFSNSEKSTVSRLDATESLLQAIATRLESGSSGDTVSASAVRDAIEGMAERVARAEKIAAEAAQLKAEAGESVDADFIHKTGLRLRILGDEIKRGGDQIRTLESTISRLAQQIDAAEKRSAEGVQKVAETIADLRSQFSNADASDQASARAEIEAAVSEITQRTEDRIELLQQSFDTMVRRLEAAGGRGREPQAEAAPQRPVSAAYKSEPAPKVSSSLIDDLDTELQDAFAALDLEEPVPTHAAVIAVAPEAVEADDFEDDGDDFGFDAEETDASASSETEDVLAEIREAFGIDAPIAKDDPESEDEEAPVEAEAEDEDVAELAPPPVAFAAGDASQAQARADYLKAARQAAREAAAKAAEEEAAPKKKLTPKQRAILAARIKRRKQEAEDAKAAEAAALTAPAVDRTSVEDAERADAKASVKARVAGLVAKLKLRPAPKIEEASSLDEAEAATAPKAAAPNILAGVNAVTAKLKKIPNAGGVLGLVGAIVLAGAAAFLMFKDTLGKKPVRPAARVEAPAADVYAPAANDRIAPSVAESPLVRPRELYLENIASLKSATTDGDARAALTHIEQAASLGHPPAQLQIGELYKLGQLYDRDLGQARMWFERAANGGNVLAMHRLGVMAARGEGGPVDPAASVSWFEKASSFGLVDSQYNLGATFHPTPEGAGAGIQDRAKAYFWYSIAAKNGDAQAGEMAAGLAGTMPAAERSAKDAEVAAWAPKTPDPAANELAPAE
jgi:localization factor PodJL